MVAKKKKDKLESFDETITKPIFKVIEQQSKNAYILFLKGHLLGKLCTLEKGKTIIGRSAQAGIPLKDSGVSREHLEIEVDGEKATIRDLGSTNGTFVNNKRISRYTLRDGDKIQISSSTVFKFIVSDESEKVFHDELYRMGVMDPVTNIYNKRYFTERLKQEFSLAKRNKTELSLLMIDLDFFKKINDIYGHLAGDFVLGKISEIFSTMTRDEDIVARYGGEEFVAILPGSGEEGAVICAERIREKIAQTSFMFEGTKINITVSIGVATLDENSLFGSYEDFIEVADNCLYRSKKSGRNCTTCSSEAET
jgi:two-component system cell cycle response regulator